MIKGVHEAVKKLALAHNEITRLTQERDQLRAVLRDIVTMCEPIIERAKRLLPDEQPD